MNKKTIQDIYDEYQRIYRVPSINIDDDFIDGELTVIDDIVGGFIYLATENNAIRPTDVHSTIQRIKSALEYSKKLDGDDYLTVNFHLNIQLFFCELLSA